MGYYNPEIHHRRSIRLKDYDYSQLGAYFITICTYGRMELFGEIRNNEMCLNERGKIAEAMWDTLPKRFAGTELDHFVVMPNHVHGIIVRTQPIALKISEGIRGTINGTPTLETVNRLRTYRMAPHRKQMLNEMIRTFKAVTSYYIHTSGTPEFAWQREYYEHVIRNAKELDVIREYIINNPAKWGEDKLHP